MASRYIVLIKNGGINTCAVRRLPEKRARKTLVNWKASCASKAIDWGCRHYAARFKGRWHVMSVSHPEPLRAFDTEDAAAMWLLFKEKHVVR